MKCAWTYSVCRRRQSKNKGKNKSEGEGMKGRCYGESVGFYGFENVPFFFVSSPVVATQRHSVSEGKSAH